MPGNTTSTNGCNNSQPPQKQGERKGASLQSLCEQQIDDDDVKQLDNDYRDVFMRRLATEMQAEGIAANYLKRRFGLAKETLDRLLPEYKLLLGRYDLHLYSYCQEVLTARYMHSKRIGSDTVLESAIQVHSDAEVDTAAAETARKAHKQRWQTVQQQRLHKASRTKLDSVMELIRTEDRPVVAFPDDVPPRGGAAGAEDSATASGEDAAVVDGRAASKTAGGKPSGATK